MTNAELEKRVQEIIEIDNYFDMKLKAKAFEKEYKESDFYKETKMPLNEMLKEARTHYLLKLDSVISTLQKAINELDLTKINDLLDQIGIQFGTENKEIEQMLGDFKNLKN